MNTTLAPGLSAHITHRVEERHLASKVGSGLVSVFSTAMMIAFMEEAAVAAVQPSLPDGYTTVGIHVDVEHKAATPEGMLVRFEAILKEISASGKKMTFEVSAHDEAGIIGSGIHHRVLVNQAEFESRSRSKLPGGE